MRKSKSSTGSYHKDRISYLPDRITGHILSFLPTKDALKTCVLSKAWQYKWTSVSNITIDDVSDIDRYEGEHANFISILDRIFHLLPDIKSFELATNERYDVNVVASWMSALLSWRNIENFKLEMLGDIGVILPHSFLNFASLLRKFWLHLVCTIRVRQKIHFPNLTNLLLLEVCMLNDNTTTSSLSFTFPVLKRLGLTDCRWKGFKYVEIYAPSLECFHYETQKKGEAGETIIKIVGARPFNFRCYDFLSSNVDFTESEVDLAELLCFCSKTNISAGTGLNVGRLMNAISDMCLLEITCFAAVIFQEGCQSGISIPVYDKMEKLILFGFAEKRCKSSAYVKALFMLLHAAPFLQVLIIDMKSPNSPWADDDDDDSRHMCCGHDVCELVEDDFDYEAVESIPSCVVSHLRKVKFRQFENSPRILNLARFLLKNSVNLKEFCIGCTGDARGIDGIMN